MSRRSRLQQKKRDWRFYASFILNGAVALSMVLGTVLLFAPPPSPAAPPTLLVPTIAPTPVPTFVPPSPTPKASTMNYELPFL